MRSQATSRTHYAWLEDAVTGASIIGRGRITIEASASFWIRQPRQVAQQHADARHARWGNCDARSHRLREDAVKAIADRTNAVFGNEA